MVKFSDPQNYIITTTQNTSLFLAGVGSGKTHIGGFLSGYYIHNFPKAIGFIAANTYQQLTTSTLFRIREVWRELFGWVEGEHYVVGKQPPKHFNTESHNYDSYKGIISFAWGTVVFKGSLDNAKAHDGKEFAWAILDETKDTREDDVKETIVTRLRGGGIYVDRHGQLTPDEANSVRAFMPLYILTSPAKVDWINEWFDLDAYQTEILAKIFDKDDFYSHEIKDKCVVISSTYHNEANLPKGYIERVLNNNSEQAAKKLIYGNPFVKGGGEFYSFDRIAHVKEIPFNPELPIHLSFDQNTVPYITATLYQVFERDGKTIVNQFDEMCLKKPRNKTNKLCLEFVKRYGRVCDGLYIYGDPAGRYSDTRGVEHDYDIVKRILRPYLNNQSFRVPHKHPSVLQRKNFINTIFEKETNILVYVSKKCKNSIADFEHVKEDHNGKKLKAKTRDKMSGTTYEKYGHTSDSFDYFMCKCFERDFMKYVK